MPITNQNFGVPLRDSSNVNESISNTSAITALFDGIGQSLCVWPGDISLSNRKSNYYVSIFSRMSSLVDRLEKSNLKFGTTEENYDLYFRGLLSFSGAEKMEAAKHFSSIGVAGIAPLLVLTRDHDIRIRDNAFNMIKNIVRYDVKSLLLLLSQGDREISRLVISSLSSLREDMKGALEVILNDKDHLMRSYALYAISNVRNLDRNLFKSALSLWDDESDFVRKRVADVISAHGDLDLLLSRKVVEDLLKDKSRLVVIAAIDAVSCFPNEDSKQFISILERLLSSPSHDVRDKATATLTQIAQAN